MSDQELSAEEQARARAEAAGLSLREYRIAEVIGKASLSAGSPMGDEQVSVVASDVAAWFPSLTVAELLGACTAAWREHQARGRSYGYPGAGAIANALRRARHDAEKVNGPEDGKASPYRRGPDCRHGCRAGIVTLLSPDSHEVAVSCNCSGGAARRARQPGLWGKSRGVSALLAEGWGYLGDDEARSDASQAMADYVNDRLREGATFREARAEWRGRQQEERESRAASADWMRR